MPQNEVVDPSVRKIINSNFDTNNVVSIEQTRERILATLDSCAQALKEHCGPRSGYAMLIDDQGIDFTFQPSQFTRDGIRILKAIEYISPLERYIKNILTYVGERVDFIAKDGTTTSMLYAALLLSVCLKNKEHLFTGGSLYQINKIIDTTFSGILAHFKQEVITIDDLLPENATPSDKLEMAGKIAYMQALSSSGGDFELAEAMREIFRRSPEETWEFIDYYTSAKETGERYSVEINDYDAKIRCINACSVPMNEALGTEYVEEEADVIVFPGPMMQQDFAAVAVMDYIDKSDKNKPIVILASMVDGMFTSRIAALNKDRSKPITIWQHSPKEQIAGQNYPWELMILAAKAGVTPPLFINGFDGQITDEHIFKAKVHWKDTYLHFYDCIYRGDDPQTVLHPYYLDPSKATKFYTDCVNSVESLLKDYREGHRPDGRMYAHFMQVLNDLVSIKRPKLRIGGTVHEQVASQDVVQDVQGAIMSSLRHGFVVNGIRNFLNALDYASIEMGTPPFVPDFEWELQYKLIKFMYGIALQIYRIIHGNEKLGLSEFPLPPLTKFGYNNNLDRYKKDRDFKTYLDLAFAPQGAYIESMRDFEKNAYPVMQPAKVTEELLKRIQELIMKVVMTDKAIVYGGVMVKEEKEGESCQ